jgi:hypothetical protein
MRHPVGMLTDAVVSTAFLLWARPHVRDHVFAT